MTLKIDWCSPQAAKYACEHWHYSASFPSAGATCVGVWEDDLFAGAIVFGKGANSHIHCPYGLSQNEVCELVRVALRKHAAPVSQCVGKAVRMLKQHCPKLRLIVSYADEGQNHTGVIYQAMNWIYTGIIKPSKQQTMVNGVKMHGRSVVSKYGTSSMEYIKKNIDPNAELCEWTNKHKYLYPLDKKMRKQIMPLSKPYPKKEQSEAV